MRIYVAGRINSDAAGYIKNVNKMVNYGEKIRKMGAAVHIPANDFIHGVVCGNHNYNDYFDNNIEWLLVSDAVALTPGWMKSEGTLKEIEIAKKNNIPVLESIYDVREFISNKKPQELGQNLVERVLSWFR